jgi:uncharacterized protein YdeI (YjbR/CyaY-like superfamily)
MSDGQDIPGGVVHDLPGDLEGALKCHPTALATWQDIPPLARNEWICWIESAKKQETRRKRLSGVAQALRMESAVPAAGPDVLIAERQTPGSDVRNPPIAA